MNELHEVTSADRTGRPANRVLRVVSTKSLQSLKWSIWAYFLLLIVEGSLRKWFLPGLATPLLIVRDPVALGLLLMAIKWDLFPVNGYVIGIIVVGIIGTITAVLVGHGNLMVAVFGLRIMILHFPLMFVIGRVFTRNDVLKMGRVTIWMMLPMTVLIALQFYSPQSAWVNRGVGGDMEGAGFSGALDYFRPPGTFSFTSGNSNFYSMAACLILYFWISSDKINRWLLIVATGSLLASIPLSISRTLLFQVCLCIAFAGVAVVRQPKLAGRLGLMALGAMVIVAGLSQTSFFNTAITVLTTRFESASEFEGGLKGTLGDRFLGGMVSAITNSTQLPFFGYGIGMGTNVASMLMSGERTFLIAEEEWARTIGELGLILGLTVILIRISLTINMVVSAFKKLAVGDLLPWMLLSYGMLIILQAGWAQPTSLGFCTLMGGLILASLRDDKLPPDWIVSR